MLATQYNCHMETVAENTIELLTVKEVAALLRLSVPGYQTFRHGAIYRSSKLVASSLREA